MADDNGQPTAVAEPEAPTKSAKKGKAAKKKKPGKKAVGASSRSRGAGRVKFPKHSIMSCIRIPQAILEQNVGEA